MLPIVDVTAVATKKITIANLTAYIASLVETLTNKTLTTPVINGLATGTGVSSTSAASTIATRDVNSSLAAQNINLGLSSTVTAGATTTLNVASNFYQFFTGSSNQTVQLPVASTLTLGQSYSLYNLSTGTLTINSSGGNQIFILAASSVALMTCTTTSGTGTASWGYNFFNVGAASGKFGSFSNSLILAGTDGTTLTFPGTSQTIAGLTSTQTFSNKRITRRFVTTTQSATPTINTDNTDVSSITALAQAITSMTTNLSGTPSAGDFLEIQITDNGTARAITWGASFAASTVALPTTTVISTLLHVLFEWDTVSAKWVCVATA